LIPFYAGTYFPPEDHYNRPGFKKVITQIASTFKSDRENVNDYAERLVEALVTGSKADGEPAELDNMIADKMVKLLLENYDSRFGGFGQAPKFPHPTDLSFMIKMYAKNGDEELIDAVTNTLNSMARGGIYDQVGGGFHRYSTDEKWLVPHFEKMLYDNAMLAATYAEAYQVTGYRLYKRIVKETLDFMLREMSFEQGGFYSSLDADSEGEEGRFYVWTKEEIEQILKDNSSVFGRFYNITSGGNFERGLNILNITDESKKAVEQSYPDGNDFEKFLEGQRSILLKEREKRIRPFTDDKILTSWNGLAITGFVKGYQITGEEKYIDAAIRAVEFIRDNLYQNNRLLHSIRLGKVSEGEFLEDYAYYIRGLLDLYEITFDFKLIEFASSLADYAAETFIDKYHNLYLSPGGLNDHFMRPQDFLDGALPAPGSIFIHSLFQLAEITGSNIKRKEADKMLKAMAGRINQNPNGMTSAVNALDYHLSEKTELLVIGEENLADYVNEIYLRYFPDRIIIISATGSEAIPLLKGRKFDGKTTAYLCRNFACLLPARTIDDFREQLEEISVTNKYYESDKRTSTGVY
jgi:uncharacterized protein YyaL (SSP411 family)